MGFFSRFERRVEDGFEGINDKLFDAPISPVQIAKKAEKQMRREKMVGAGKEFAPTLYTVLVNPSDDERLFGYYPTLAGETETYLAAKAMEEGLAMDGSPLVRFIVDDELKSGKFDIIAEMVSAPIVEQLRAEEMERYGLAGAQIPQAQAPAAAPQAGFAGADAAGAAGGNGAGAAAGIAAGAGVAAAANVAAGAVPSQYASTGIDVMAEDPNAQTEEPHTMVFNNTPAPTPAPQPAPHAYEPHLINLTTGRAFTLGPARVLIGRAINCDIVLNDLNVSRTHAEISHDTETSWSVTDLGSTNGTLVNGRHVAHSPLNEGDRITVGTTTFLFTYRQ